MILLIDNYDSFVHNLARYFRRLGQETVVRRNDMVTVSQIGELAPAAIVLSPGPCTPVDAGISLELVKSLHERVAILGVCLGHQAIAAALGGTVIRAETPIHGRATPVTHEGTPLFQGVPCEFDAARYHSLVVDERTLPETLQVTARSADGTIMAIEHQDYPLVGVQFHPESILTDVGYRILANFLGLAGLKATSAEILFASERPATSPRPLAMPKRPVAFQEIDPL